MRKIFIDIGSHTGQTLEEVIKPIHKFDVIYSFEPIKYCVDIMKEKFSDDRIIFNNFGLFKNECTMTLYGTETLGASIFEEKNQEYDGRTDESCIFVEAAKWFSENINDGDIVHCKMNCEGAECDIIENLLTANQYDKITNLLIDFDCIKIPKISFRKKEILDLLKEKNNFIDGFPQGSTHQDRIKNFINLKP